MWCHANRERGAELLRWDFTGQEDSSSVWQAASLQSGCEIPEVQVFTVQNTDYYTTLASKVGYPEHAVNRAYE